MDNELFELCKEVYEKTKWETDEGFRDTLLKDSVILDRTFPRPNQHRINHPDKDLGTYDVCPLYNSDYLLEKLKTILLNEEHKVLYLQLHHIDRNRWRAGYKSYQYVHADTPLKALLKLVVALDDAGVKLNEPV